MEHLRLEIFDLEGTGSKFAWLSEDGYQRSLRQR